MNPQIFHPTTELHKNKVTKLLDLLVYNHDLPSAWILASRGH